MPAPGVRPNPSAEQPTRGAFVVTTALALLLAAGLLTLQTSAVDGWAGLLQVGEESELRPFVERQLGPVPLAPGDGHDGQISFAIGTDLTGSEVPELLDHAGYRYRRILYPALSSGLGVLDGQALLVGLIVLAAAGFAVACGSIGHVAARRTLPLWALLGIFVNPGAWLGMWMLTSDALGLGFALAAVAAFISGRSSLTIGLLMAAVLTKDQYLLVAAGLALVQWKSDRVRAGAMVFAPVAGLAAWSWWVSTTIEGGFTPRGNLALPFAGIAAAMGNWRYSTSQDLVLGWFTLALVLVATAVALWSRRRLWIALIIPWSLLAICSSEWVWNVGNNAARVFAILGAFSVLAYADGARSRLTGPALEHAHCEVSPRRRTQRSTP
jgi:hypothetical protein